MMADSRGQEERLEDRLRRMILTEPPDQTNQTRPVVRLPIVPASSQHSQAQRGPSTHTQPRHHNAQQRPYHNASSPHVGIQPPFQQRDWRAGPQQHSQSSQRYNNYGQIAVPEDMRPPYLQAKAAYLHDISLQEVQPVQMTLNEISEKHDFRQYLERICNEVCYQHSMGAVNLLGFGSFESGFAFAGSDVDLAIMPQTQATAPYTMMEDDLPRLLEARLLKEGFGAKLLPNTRVPIIKLCERPSEEFLDKLRQERAAWEVLSLKKKYPHLAGSLPDEEDTTETSIDETAAADNGIHDSVVKDGAAVVETDAVDAEQTTAKSEPQTDAAPADGEAAPKPAQQKRRWQREREPRSIDFPKSGVGILTDINFYNALGLHNTHLLKCYSACDPRVREMILFVKTWAKKRKINNTYCGTLSSYGYVLMVLHYLIFVAKPPVLPNLQSRWRPPIQCLPPGARRTVVDGHVVDFWDQLAEIETAARLHLLTENVESTGSLLAGFFRYFAAQSGGPSFHWNNQVISFGMPKGFKHKDAKGWTTFTTTEIDGKRVQNFYLLAIEDPFELTHNVARTVHQAAFYAIKDEFWRAHRILNAHAYGLPAEDLFMEATADQGRYAGPVIPGGKESGGAREDVRRTGPAQASVDTGSQDAFPSLAKEPPTKANVETKPASRAPAVKTEGKRKKKVMQRLDLN